MARQMNDEQVVSSSFIKREKVVTSRNVDGVTYSLEWTRCGHAQSCGRCRVAYYGHGPYWYARYWDATKGKRGRTITKYIGRHLRYLSTSELPDRAPRGRPPEKHLIEPGSQ